MARYSIKKEKFVLEYFECGNASEAYRYAYKTENMSDRTIYNEASKLLKDHYITTRLAELRKEVESRTNITVDNVVNEIKRIAFFDIKKIFTEDNSLKSIQDLDIDTSRAISSIKVRIEKTGENEFAEVIEIKPNDKIRALEMLMKYLGGYEVDNNQTNKVKIELETAYMRELQDEFR